MSGMVDLRLDWCSHEAAKYAVEHWHYSQRMPKSKLVKIGVWEDAVFVGVIIFGCGASPEIGTPYGLTQTQTCELVRVALQKHASATSKIVAIALRMLRKSNPGLRVVVSFADSSQGHHGGIYQAGGWIYTGSAEYHCYVVNGQKYHPRTLGSRYGRGGQSIPWLQNNVDPNAKRIRNGVKHKYVMALDEDMRSRIIKLAKPYPKRVESVASGTPAVQAGRGGASPTSTLHFPAQSKA